MISLFDSIDNYHDHIRCTSPSDNPKDSVSCLSWLNDSIFACSSWDSTIRIYQVNAGLNPSLTQESGSRYITEDPCLSLAWISPSQIIAGCVDNRLKLIDRETGNITSFEERPNHDDAISAVYWSDELRVIISVSYDKSLKLWDIRSQKPLSTLRLGGKPICSDFNYSTLALALHSEKIAMFRISEVHQNLNSKVFQVKSPFLQNENVTAISLFKHDSVLGLSLGSECGRGYIGNPPQDLINTAPRFLKDRFYYISHYSEESSMKIVYPITALGMHPTFKTLFTAGSNGQVHFWNYESKKRCGSMLFKGNPVTRAKFNPSGAMIAYANGYDYSQGIQGSHLYENRIGVYVLKPEILAPENIERSPIRRR